MSFSSCIFEKNNFCTAFICYSDEKCRAKNIDGKPLYTDYENREDIKIKDKVKKEE